MALHEYVFVDRLPEARFDASKERSYVDSAAFERQILVP